MDKEKLSQLGYLNREIELLKKQIDNVEFSAAPKMTTDSVKGSSTEFPYVQHPIKIQGIDLKNYYLKVERLKRKYKRRLDELMDSLEEINEYISSIDDSEMRQILSLRYVNGLHWQQIAKHLGYQDESAPRKKHDRFLK